MAQLCAIINMAMSRACSVYRRLSAMAVPLRWPMWQSRWLSGAEAVLPEALLPDYHRLSQAERERAERLAAEAARTEIPEDTAKGKDQHQ